ncbi:MAG: histidine phosphatase family protein [Maricaulaceae bacterium]|nr:histidine phosphatase family protein [Maricaulaceae bacterium]
MSAPAVTPTQDKPGFIAIARHGRPDCDRTVRIGWRDYEDWWADYDRAGLAPGQEPPKRLVKEAQGAKTLFASTLPRAIETARAAAPGRELIIDERFVEAPLPPPRWPLRFTPRTWGVYARCAWWLGFARGRETRGQAEARAEQAAEILVQAARHGGVALFAHGWFNRMLRPALKRRGWRCVRDHGDRYWTHRRYEYFGP